MIQEPKITYHKRLLPHYEIENSYYFITFRLAFTLPDFVLDKLKKDTDDFYAIYNQLDSAEKINYNIEFFKYKFTYYDEILDKNEHNLKYLLIPEIADIVIKSLQYFDGVRYDIVTYCIMSNHVHLVIKIKQNENIEFYSLTNIMHSIKSFTSNKCNKFLNQKGQFWHHESFDHIIRNQEEFIRYISYTINNPVKSGLVSNWQDWKYTYLAKKYMEEI